MKDQVLMITGGTGSFGTAVLNSALSSELAEIRIFSRDEKKQDDMRRRYADGRLRFYIGDVRDRASVDQAMRGVDHVFHAAALKQVPTCEFFPLQAVQTNVLGTENVLEAAYRNGVARVVVLSTDKAVYPINAMGMSKALMEKVMVAYARAASGSRTVVCGTRYGNVMGSRGSVIPLFEEQIRAGQPLTVTDPDMTRFMMTLPESVALVFYAFAHAQPGDIFVQKAPASTIGTLAEAMRQLYGVDNPIRVIGTRHGEKLFESLIHREDMPKAEDLGTYYRVPADNRDLNYARYFSAGDARVAVAEEYNSHNTERLDVDAMVALLRRIGIGPDGAWSAE